MNNTSNNKKQTNNIFLIALQGVAMALADSVPGVSGGTIAFILGYYDRFIGAINDLFYAGKDKEKRKKAFFYLLKFMVGWIAGFLVAVVLLNKIFNSHIYVVCSVFLGFVLAAVPVIIIEEIETLKKSGKWWHFIFSIAGAAVVVLVAYFNVNNQEQRVITSLDFGMVMYILIAGAVAITAMFLPGMSGSTLMLVFGLYIPIMTGIKAVLGGDLRAIPALLIFIVGAAGGALASVKAIRICLDKFRSQSIFFIIGMLIGSLYAIFLGPTTLDEPLPMMDFSTFNGLAFAGGIVVIIGMELIKLLIKKKKGN